MSLFWKAAAAVLIALVLGKSIKENELGLMLSMAVCIMVGMIAVTYLTPIGEFLKKLKELGNLQGDMLGILLKVLGIAIVTELTEMICKDSGNASLGQAMVLLGTCVILWLSLPIFEMLMAMIQRILGEI